MVIDRVPPVLAHAWIGSMRQDGDHALIGWIDLDPAAHGAFFPQPPRRRGTHQMRALAAKMDSLQERISVNAMWTVDAPADR